MGTEREDLAVVKLLVQIASILFIDEQLKLRALKKWGKPRLEPRWSWWFDSVLYTKLISKEDKCLVNCIVNIV